MGVTTDGLHVPNLKFADNVVLFSENIVDIVVPIRFIIINLYSAHCTRIISVTKENIDFMCVQACGLAYLDL